MRLHERDTLQAVERGEHAALPGDDAQACRKQEALAYLNEHPYSPPWWLRGGHAQTVWGSFLRRKTAPPRRKETWETPDGDFLNIHLTEGQARRPAVLLLHGLEGSAFSHYILGLTWRFRALGWTTAAMEYRGCGGVMNRAFRLYHSGETSDPEFVVHELIKRYPDCPLFLVGASLGGNIIAKWFGEQGGALPAEVHAGAAISPPFDLTVSARRVDTMLGGAYARWFTRSMVPKALEKERQFPGQLDREAVSQSKTFAEFDTHVTAVLHGFRDAEDYWAKSGCGPFLPGVRRPLLLIAAEDDPMSPGETLPRKTANASPWLHPLFTKRGGHVGFVQGRSPFHPRYWAEEQVVRFLSYYAERAG